MKRSVILLLSLVLILASCNFTGNEAAAPVDTEALLSEEDADENQEETEEPQESGEETDEDSPYKKPLKENKLKLSMRSPKTLNPLLNEDITVDNALKLVFEQVMELDESFMPMPNLAQRVEFDEDGLGMTIELRSDIKWSDGNSLTASDLVFSVQFIQNSAPSGSLYKDTVRNIASISVVDTYTARATLVRPTGGIGYNLCFPVIPEHYYKNQTDPDADINMRPLGCGPYIFEQYTLVEEMALLRNRAYYKGPPNIENISVRIISDTETDFYAFEQGIIDALRADVLEWGKYSGTKPTVITEYPTNYFDFVGFNLKHYDDKRIREAVARCINVDEIVDSVYLGHAVRTTSIVNPSSWAYESNTSIYNYDKDAARALFMQSGYVDSGNGGVLTIEIAGVSFELSFKLLVNEENNERMQLAELLKNNLEEAGAKVEVIACDFDTYTQRLRNGEFDLFVGGFNFSPAPDFTFAFGSSQVDTGSNYFNYKSETLDALLAIADGATNEADYKKTLSDIQKHIADELPLISLVFRKSAVMTDEKVQGNKLPVLSNIYTNIYEWEIN